MSKSAIFIQKDSALIALAEEIDLTAQNTQVATELSNLKLKLHAHWYQTPVAQDGIQKYAKPALMALRQDSTVLGSLTKYKTKKTVETRFNGKRAHKRYYFNADSVQDLREVSSVVPSTPWGAEYRLAGNVDTTLAAFEASNYTRRESAFTSAVALSLNDYCVGSYHTSNDFRSGSYVSNVTWPNTSGNAWQKAIPERYSLLTFADSGRYLITGRFLLRLLGKINSTSIDFDKDAIYEIRNRTGGTNTSSYNYLENYSNNVDENFPSFRIKALHYGEDATMPNGRRLKNIFYSNVINYSLAGMSIREHIAGIRFLTSIAQGDTIQFILERTPFVVYYKDTNRQLRTLDAVCAYKKKDFDAYVVDRDKNNFIEVTRISGLLNDKSDNQSPSVPSPTPPTTPTTPTPTPTPSTPPATNPPVTPTPTPNTPTPSPNPSGNLSIPMVIENDVDETIYKVDFFRGHLGDVLPSNVIKSAIVGSEIDGALTGVLYDQNFSFSVSNLDGWHIPANGLIRVLLSFKALENMTSNTSIGIGFDYPEYSSGVGLSIEGQNNLIKSAHVYPNRNEVGPSNAIAFNGKSQCYFVLDFVIDFNTNTGYMYLVSEDTKSEARVISNLFYPPVTTLKAIQMYGIGQKIGITGVELRTTQSTECFVENKPYDYPVLNTFSKLVGYGDFSRKVVLNIDNAGYMWISREGNTFYTKNGVLPPQTPHPSMTCTVTKYSINVTTSYNNYEYIFPFKNKTSTTVSKLFFREYVDLVNLTRTCI